MYYKLIFSPTGGTQMVADLLGAALHHHWEQIDLSLPSDMDALTSEDICLVAVPSFGGRVPAVAVERLHAFRGGGARAILLCVYGNRAYEDTLAELQDTLEAVGFRCVAAVAAVAEHSIMRQFASGRPDADDQKDMAAFARQIQAKLKESSALLPPLPGSHGSYKNYKGTPFKPQVSGACTACGLCARKCPAGAIDPAQPQETRLNACISCMRCIALCPAHARTLDSAMLAGAAGKMAAAFAGRKKNELFCDADALQNAVC